MLIKLKTDGKYNPIGVGRERVRLSVYTEGVCAESYAFEIFKTHSDACAGNAFYSVKSDSRYVYVDGARFADCTEYFWQATVFCENGETVRSELAWFETGISSNNFTAKWVKNSEFDGHASEFKKEFEINGRVKKARLYIVGLGFYKSFINGTETDDFYYKPVLTDFSIRKNLNNIDYDEENFKHGDKTVSYNVFDVTRLLKKGKNVLSVLSGTGWYCNTDKLITDLSFNFSDTPKLIFELRVTCTDGEIKVCSDGCECRNVAVISQLFACDKIDFTAEELPFKSAALCEPPSGRLIPSECENDAVIEEIFPRSVTEKDGVTEYDFGKNHTGGLAFSVKGTRGSKLVLRYYETKKNGVLNPETSRWPAYKDGKYLIGHLDQTCEYILSGNEDEISPYFHWSGYRYVTLECDGEYRASGIKSLFISADIEKDGFFESSDAFLNRLNEAFLLTQRGNMHCGVPSDCPHREKLPYTGDGCLAAETVTYSLDAENFYRKWLKDIIASQGKNGFVPYTAPYIAGMGGHWWSNALVIIPFVIYNLTGDKQVIADAFEPCLKLIEYYDALHAGDYIITKSCLRWYLGDWLAPEVMEANKDYLNTLAFYFAVTETQKMCDVLGKTEQKANLERLRLKIKRAINERFFDKENLNYCNGIQGENVLPAVNGVADERIAEKLLKKMVEKYEKDPHFDTGIVLTPRLLDALTSAGRSDVAYKVLTEKTFPSYFAMLENETTLPESWGKCWPGNPDSEVSHNHPMFGSVLCWVYKNVAGLDLSALCDKKVIFGPKLIKEVKSAKCSKITPYGKASVDYRAEENFVMDAEVPFGCTGEIGLPPYIKDVVVHGGKIIETKEDKTGKTLILRGGKYRIEGRIE